MAVARSLAVVDAGEQVPLVQLADALGVRVVCGEQHAEIREEIGGNAGTQVLLNAGQEIIGNAADDAQVVFARDILVTLVVQELANFEVIMSTDDRAA